ncbi:MAG: zinc-binding dehydrogenase [Gemmatimonadales bacterium]
MALRAAVMVGPNRPIENWSIDDPEIDPGGILLETIASEVCGTDVHLLHGRLDGVPYPIIPGHVSVGRIAELNAVERDFNGRHLSVGDTVTFYDVHEICGQCWYCAVALQPNRCPHRRVYGITYPASDGPLGGWCEAIYLKPGVRVFKLNSGLGPDDVIGGGCGMFTGFAALDRAEIRLGDIVLVQGTGPVGLAAIAFAHFRGAALVIATGDPEARLELAADFGADVAMSVSETTADERRERVADLTAGRGVDAAIEATGNPQAVDEGLHHVRDGGRYVVAGHYTDTGAVAINPHTQITRKHVEIMGQWGTDLRHVSGALRLAARHRIPFRRIAGRRYSLERANEALDDVANLRVTKAIIAP